MPLAIAIPALAGTALFGWSIGMLTFKRSRMWCTRCGHVLTCAVCAAARARRLNDRMP